MSEAPDAMRLALYDRPDADTPTCSANRRNNTGAVAVSCSFPAGHAGDHTDVHAGRSWT